MERIRNAHYYPFKLIFIVKKIISVQLIGAEFKDVRDSDYFIFSVNQFVRL